LNFETALEKFLQVPPPDLSEPVPKMSRKKKRAVKKAARRKKK
jgi:hypothetical protein